jgi:hypothetical protein
MQLTDWLMDLHIDVENIYNTFGGKLMDRWLFSNMLPWSETGSAWIFSDTPMIMYEI